jgi:hypothetical protein
MKRSTFESDWAIGDRVYIDGDQSIKATVTAFKFNGASECVQCEWMHNGDPKHDDIQPYRLRAAE